MSDESRPDRLRLVDNFGVPELASAFTSMHWTEKARAMVAALASAPNRALSRTELAWAVGSQSVNSTNSVLGTFCRMQAMSLDPTLVEEWRPSRVVRRDWVAFACTGGRRWNEPSEGEVDAWVFVLREPLARALESIGVAPFQEISEDTADVLRFDGDEGEGEEDEHDGVDDNLFAEIEAASDNEDLR